MTQETSLLTPEQILSFLFLSVCSSSMRKAFILEVRGGRTLARFFFCCCFTCRGASSSSECRIVRTCSAPRVPSPRVPPDPPRPPVGAAGPPDRQRLGQFLQHLGFVERNRQQVPEQRGDVSTHLGGGEVNGDGSGASVPTHL